jgi:hypothetical protein
MSQQCKFLELFDVPHPTGVTMKDCCVKALNDIQQKIEDTQITCLMLLLAPWIILLGDTPTDAEVAAQFLARLTVEQAIAKLVPEMPDELDAVSRAMSPILLDRLSNLVLPEWLNTRHTPREQQFWRSYMLRYRQEKM